MTWIYDIIAVNIVGCAVILVSCNMCILIKAGPKESDDGICRF